MRGWRISPLAYGNDALKPFSFDTRPTFLDMYDTFFKGTPHDANASIHGTSTLTAPTVVGATTFNVATSAGLATGELVWIGSTLANVETLIVNTVGVGTFTTTTGALYAHASGESEGQVWLNATHPTTQAYPNMFLYMLRSIFPGQKYSIPYLNNRPIVVLGDSWTTQSFSTLQTAFTTAYPNSVLLNYGASGERADQQLLRLPAALATGASLVLHLSGWMNDLSAGRTNAQMEANLNEMVLLCREAGAKLVEFGPCPWSGGLAASTSANDALQAYIASITV